MPRIKGTGIKAKLSVTVDKIITDKLDQRFKGDRGRKSEVVNLILSNYLDIYLSQYTAFSPTLSPLQRLIAKGELDQSQVAGIDDDEIMLVIEAARRDVEGK